MKVGILSTCQYSMFSGGLANTTITFYELMKTLGHDVTILNTNIEVTWYDDCKTLQPTIQVCNINDNTEIYDFVLELVPFLDGEKRKLLGKRFVSFHRKSVLIPTIEYSLYPIINTKANYDGVEAIWCFKEFCDDSEQQILEVLTQKPVIALTYLWTPTIIEAHKNELQSPFWLQNSSSNPQPNWSPHIFETNSTSSSSSTIPLLTLRQAKLANFPIIKYKVHNIDQINKSQFFKDNVLKHCETADLSGEFVGRQRIVDLAHEPMSCVVSHVRFLPFKPMLFDMAWAGIPFVHNSEFLKNVTCFERYYYPDNKISEAVHALEHIDEDFKVQKGWFDIENIQAFRRYVLEHYSCLNPAIVNMYRAVVDKSPSVPSVLSIPSSIPPSLPLATKKILFTDMWENFNPYYNFFTLLLENANPNVKIEYYSTHAQPDAIIFGPFGNKWKEYPHVPKIHFTGENTGPIEEAALNLGFHHSDMVDEKYLRFPLWILEIDWFGCDINKIANPKPIPLERCTKVFYDELERKKFCAFVVSNPSNPIRNKAFQWLNEYKPIDSAGRLYNNIGDTIFAGLGGGGGELAKLEFLKDYKFCITFENSSSQGYVTEKLLHAKAAGCIPIYWGDPKVERDFDTKGFIDARKIHCKEDLLALVKTIDEDPKKYLEMYEKPALDEYRVLWARRTMSECASRIFTILGSTNEVPRFVETKVVKSVNPSQSIQTPLLVTYATRNFLPSLNQWLASFDAQRRVTDLRALVYLGTDVPEEAKQKFQETFPFITYEYLPILDIPQFPDIFESEHYAWKIYIYQDLVNNKGLEGQMVFYMDAGAFMCRWPTEYLRIAQENDICVLTDDQQQNKQWCHETCVKKMNITQEELVQNQIVGGIMAFRVGEKSRAYFNEAWNYARDRDVIVGEKWSGIRDGKPYGHRHDQSILSILSLRHSLPTYPLHTLYCDVSLRRTFLTNKYIYVHRGNFKLHDPFLPNIDDCFVINLKRRADRLEKLYKNSPEFLNKVIIHEAYEGCQIQMTPAIGRLFKTNDFLWKKAILGCAMSHLSLWYKLATDKPDINNYLILEDDVKFLPKWQQKWQEAQSHLPENYDVIYLGGVLPPNRGGFEMTKEKINPYFSRVKENQFFGQTAPNRYFHFCAYSYVLSKQGAQKILHTIMANSYYTSADHMICNPVNFLNIYFLDPLVAGCYQDDDPKYAHSEFNNFNRVDNFDSDLWNNDERFTDVICEGELDIPKALEYGRKKELVKAVVNPAINQNLRIPSSSRFYCLKKYPIDWNLLYEKKWLFELFGKDFVECIQIENEIVEDGIFIVLRGQDYSDLFTMYKTKGIKYSVLHLSDEYGTEPIDYYKDATIIRNYWRGDLSENVFVLPLGYHNGFESPMDNPYERTPQLPFRKNVWSFFGTGWANRTAILEPLKHFPHELRLFDSWNDAKNLKEKEYISNLLDSIFVPCIQGNNEETFRFYEALECGCIPILVEGPFTTYISQYIQIFPLKSWDQAPLLIDQLMNDKKSLEAYRYTLLQAYRAMKQTLKNEVRSRFKL